MSFEFSDCDGPFLRKFSESGKIRPGCGQPARSVGLGWRHGRLWVRQCSGGEGPVLQQLSALGLHASSSKNRMMHDFATKLTLLSNM